ncbi:pentatricopeptide repeat-containing protein [Canna indica]|uniref:Pentatricopeptide repeat-containing protein n=1 Tax=Canna indica TaxID=4628 RepID=A0AAQ3L737_9LILI|nr:pentatricopeptide repeat-containing protein [Canna indica]
MASSLHHHQHQHSFIYSTLIASPPSQKTLKSSLSIRDACKQGDLKQAFLSLANSLQFPPPEAYSSILELCASQKAPFQGQQVHSHILKSNSLSTDGFLSTKLLFMYGKCGQLPDAEKLFDEMPCRSVFTWNALIGAYASCGHPSLAVGGYQKMRFSGVLPDACTLASVLKACGALEDVCVGTEMHGLAVKLGLDLTGFVSNALVAMYAKCARFGSARQLFERMNEERDVVSWNSIISACLQDGKFLEALTLFREMQKAGVPMNSYTTVGILQACAELSYAKLGMEIHASLLKNIRKLEIYELNALVVLYTRCGLIGNAIRVFDEMAERDNVSWNSMLSGYIQNGLYQEAIEFFSEIIWLGFKPDQVSLISAACALGRLGNIWNAKEVHAYAIKHGFDCNLQVGNTLIDMYTKCHFIDYAEYLFHRLNSKDCISWTTMIAGYAQSSHYSKALELSRQVQKVGMKLDSMMMGSILQACSGLVCLPLLKQAHGYAIRHGLLDLVLTNTIVDVYGECGKVGHAYHVFGMIQDKDVVSWTSMITCYVNNGILNEALCLFKDMVSASVEPDAVSLISVLAATAGLSSFMKGKEIHGFIYRRQFVMDGAVSSSLVDMYARCGDIENSFKVFDNIICKDLILWTTMINASGLHGRGKEAIGLFRVLHETGIVPDHVTFLALLYACSHSRLINEGKYYLEEMTSKYGLEPWPEHYACLVDLLGRSGRIEEAYEFIQTMRVEPTPAVWCALLGACRVHQNHNLGKIAADKLLELEPENPGNYVLISNVFAAMRKWKDANVVRGMMKERGLKKDPGCSWIEVGNKVYTFVARDTSHKDSVAIYSRLAEITEKLKKEGGYIEDTRFVLHDTVEEEKIRILHGHSERLAIAFGMTYAPKGTPIRITKNLRVCSDCHEFTKLLSKVYEREIIVRDANRFHHFKGGYCSCSDFW